MQSWSNTGQSGADEQSHQHQWQPNYGFAGQNGQFDPHQPWSQPMADQAAYSHINPQDASTSNFFDSPAPGNSFLSGSLHGSPPSQSNFHGGHDSLALNQQFSQPTQDVLDPAFSDIHPDLYGQQGKMNLGDSMGHMNQVQNQVQSHSHTHSQNFQYSFAPQNEQSYESPIQQYAQPHVIPQQNRQQNHTPVQQFEGLQTPAFAHGHGYSRPPQHSPVPNQQQPYTQTSAFSPPVNGQTTQPQANPQHTYQQPRQQTLQQQQGYPQPQAQAQFITQKSVPYQQPAQNVANQSFHQVHQQSAPFTASSSPPAASAQYIMAHQPVDVENPASQPAVAEPPAKKRKRTAAKVVSETHTPEPTVAHDSPMDYGSVPGTTSPRRVDEVDFLVAPTPSAEDAQLIAQFNRRTKALQAKQPSIKGLAHFVYDASTKLPAPKSYDKLAPLVAHPSRSGKAMVPELGYSLPCEVQGRFTSLYRPSPDKGGLDERRIEAKDMLDEFDRSMKALGKRRPKYTEYPHAFKEQLKSDEASKNKAEKKAKREMEEVRSKPIRPATRPIDLAGAAAWDVTGIVHIDQSTARTTALIATRVQQAGEFIIKLRGDMNRTKQELDQAVKDKDLEAEITKIRQEFEQKKDMLYRALDATIEHADDAVIDNMGGHQKLVLSLVNALIMCIKAGDFSGKLPKIVLELFSHFPMTRRIAETTNFETVRKRFADKGDEEVKELVRDISTKVKKALKADPDTSTGYTGTSAASRAKAATRGSADHSTAKRGRDDESDTRVVKKIAVESSGNSLSKKLAQPKIQLQSASKTTAAKAAATSILPGKMRPVAKSVPKPEVVKAEVKIAGDDRSKAEVKAPTKTETKVPLPRTPSATSSALSGIASLLDSINAPKAEPLVVVPKEDKSPDTSETPEEKTKRLRKEARRKLRVSWKPEAELVQVKIFQKEEAEDEGREVHMIRDAGDDRSEGMVLKQRANVEEEDDDDDIPYQPWLEPTATNLSNLSEEVQNKNFVTRGGKVTFTTDEQQRIKDREQRELMAIYTDPDDIPPTPKSPPLEPVGGAEWKTHHLPGDDPKFQEIQLRWRDEQQMGVDGALYAATKRLDAKENPSNKLDSILGRLRGVPSAPQVPTQQSASSQQSSGPTHDSLPVILGRAVEEQVLILLRSERVKNWRDPNPSHSEVWRAFHYSDKSVHLCGNAVELVARPLAGKPFPAASPPDWIMHDQEKVREWQIGYNKEAASRQKAAEEERARAEATGSVLGAAAAAATGGQAAGNSQEWAAYMAQQKAYAPYMALLQQMTGGQQPSQQQQPGAASAQQSQIPDSQLQSILAAINQPSQQPTQTPASNPAGFLNPNDPSYQQYMMLTQLAQGQQPAAPPPPPPAGDRDRDWERGEDQRGEQRDGRDARKKRGTLPPHKPANKALIGTKPCTFWQQGKCARGDKCTFRHD